MQKGREFQAHEASKFGVEVLQIYYNRLDCRAEQIYFPYANKSHLGIIAHVPLAGGLLSGKYKPDTIFAPNDMRATINAEQLKQHLDEVERLQRKKVPRGVPMAKWTIAWCLRKPIVTSVVVGCKHPEHVRINASAIELM